FFQGLERARDALLLGFGTEKPRFEFCQFVLPGRMFRTLYPCARDPQSIGHADHLLRHRSPSLDFTRYFFLVSLNPPICRLLEFKPNFLPPSIPLAVLPRVSDND